MLLVGIVNSPLVRRAAIALDILGVKFDVEPISMFRGYDAFAAIHPAVKAPTLVLDDGTTLTDSALIIDYARSIAPRGDLFARTDPARRLIDLRITGLSLAISEDTWFALYETDLRPEEKQHHAWLDRTLSQLANTLRLADAVIGPELAWLTAEPFPLATVSMTVAVTHRLRHLSRVPFALADHPNIERLVRTAEATPVFRRHYPTLRSDISTRAGIRGTFQNGGSYKEG